ncbi:MAG: beta-ketoacyl synthase chain length factor [Bacteroidales bacterium]|jgi:hypothetical protein|nr:beta-ketoacyl synthase chain length factor [Bacteroidales bacterium]
MKDVFIIDAQQISVQNPLSHDWMEHPIAYHEPYRRAIDPDFKQYFTPNEARRYGKILKRALLTARKVMENTAINNPDAIITGTGLGCVENTELFLEALTFEGEEMLKPTHFMQSTHNTISSLIAIDAKCHGYNSTYAHKGISFECALLDAFMQLSQGEITTALVGGHDEMTPKYFSMLEKTGYLGHAKDGFSGETAVSMMLSSEKNMKAMCRIKHVEMAYGEEVNGVEGVDIDAVMIGVNGATENDAVYAHIGQNLFPEKPLLHYKHVFGESYTASGLGLYAVATCLQQQRIPAHLFVNQNQKELQGVKNILFYNQFENKNHSLILLSSCGE